MSIRMRGKGRKTELGKETARNIEPRVRSGIEKKREKRKIQTMPEKITTKQKKILTTMINNELLETLRIEEITRKGKKKFKIILVKSLITGELSGSELRRRNIEPEKIRI